MKVDKGVVTESSFPSILKDVLLNLTYESNKDTFYQIMEIHAYNAHIAKALYCLHQALEGSYVSKGSVFRGRIKNLMSQQHQ